MACITLKIGESIQIGDTTKVVVKNAISSRPGRRARVTLFVEVPDKTVPIRRLRAEESLTRQETGVRLIESAR